MIVCYLVAIAVRGAAADATNHVLRAGPLADKSYAALDAELSHQSLVDASVIALRGERAFGLQRFGEMSEDWRVGYMKLPSGKYDECDYLVLLESLIADAPRPYYDRENQDKVHSLLVSGGALTRTLVPTAEATSIATARAQALNRCLRVFNAIARRAAAGQTDEPKLADLGLPAEATVDPFNGQPLHVKKLADGWLVYSVNGNLKDDGGDIAQIDDIGLGPPSATQPKENEKTGAAP